MPIFDRLCIICIFVLYYPEFSKRVTVSSFFIRLEVLTADITWIWHFWDTLYILCDIGVFWHILAHLLNVFRTLSWPLTYTVQNIKIVDNVKTIGTRDTSTSLMTVCLILKAFEEFSPLYCDIETWSSWIMKKSWRIHEKWSNEMTLITSNKTF